MKKCTYALKATSAMMLLFFVSFTNGFAQQISNRIGEWYQQSAKNIAPSSAAFFESVHIESVQEKINYLQLDKNQFSSVLANKPALLNLSIPFGEGQVDLNLAKTSTITDEFILNTDKGTVNYNGGIHYRGIVNNDPNTIAAISIFEDDVMGFYSTAEGNFVIGKMEDSSGNYCIYNTKELPALSSFNCDVIEPEESNHPQQKTTGIGCKTVNVYFECDYKLFQDKGSNTTNVANYVNGLFNQVKTLYANENIDMQISELYVWTSTDPFVSYTTTSTLLPAFRSARGSSFNGNLAHFLTTRNLGGGIAYVDVLCSKSSAYAVSMIYNSYNNVPSYSWSVEVVTHEMGHNIGSRHTQSCTWPGGAIDNCYTTEGGCAPGPAPVNGGTIMSYCHLTSYGINFNNGFGTLPGDLIRNKVLNAGCLSGSGTAPTGLTNSNITTSSAVCAWVPVSGSTQYTVEYKLASASTWTSAGTTTGTSVTLNGLSANSNYVWRAKTDCSAFSSNASFTTLAGAGCNTPTQLNTSNITDNSATVSWGSVTGASTYSVEYKLSSSSSWTTLTSTANSSVNISGLASASTYNWRVKADCSGFSSIESFTTQNPPSGCLPPSNLNTSNISGNSATLNWSAVPSAKNYTIKISKVGQNKATNYNNVTGTSKAVTGLTPGATYEWWVITKCNGGVTSDASDIETFTTASSLVAEESNIQVKLYPNPASEVLSVEVEGWSFDELGVGEIFNIQGAKVKSTMLNAGQNNITLNEIPAGVYVLYVKKDGQKTIALKFIREAK